MKARHEGQVKERKFQVGELFQKIAPQVRGEAEAVKHKFSPKWEGPYIVEEAHQTGHYWMKGQIGKKAYSPISGAYLKKYYAQFCNLILSIPQFYLYYSFRLIIFYFTIHDMHANFNILTE